MEEITANSQVEPDNEHRILAVTATRTAYYAVVFLALLFTVIALVFPYTAMRFYIGIGNRHRALESAESYLKMYREDNPQYDGRYAGVLYRATQLAGDLFLSTDDGVRKEMYAQKTVDLTKRYFSVQNVALKNRDIDAYQIAHTPNAALHPSLYSIADYLTVNEYKANLYLGYDTKFIWPLAHNEDFYSYLNGAHADPNLASALQNQAELAAWMIVFNQLNAYIDVRFEQIGLYELENRGSENVLGNFAGTLTGNPFDLFFTHGTGGFTPLYTQITDIFGTFAEYVTAMPNNTADEALFQCYCVRTVSGFATRMGDLTLLIRAQQHDEAESVKLSEAARIWKENDVDPAGTRGYISDWYRNTLLPKYIALKSAK